MDSIMYLTSVLVVVTAIVTNRQDLALYAVWFVLSAIYLTIKERKGKQ